MDVTAVINLLQHGNQLKRTARTGWVQRGIADAETVATHSYGVVFIALVLAQIIDEPVDLGRVLAIATLHDLPESLTTDIPTPAWRYLPPGIKTEVERGAMGEILQNVSFAPDFMALWEELHASETLAAQLADDADKLDMFLQALNYQEQTGNQQLAEFWREPYQFYLPQSQMIYAELRRRWKNIA